MTERNYYVIADEGHVPIKIWNKHVKIEPQALAQVVQTASMPFVKPYVAIMPDCHFGMGATVGSVVPTQGAVMPASVGVDIGCGVLAVRTNLSAAHLDDPRGSSRQDLLQEYFRAISAAVPHGRTNDGGANDRGAWGDIPTDIQDIWNSEFSQEVTGNRQFRLLRPSPIGYDTPFNRHPQALSKNAERQLGTLGTGNHFIEVCVEIDNPDSNLWIVIHSGSRGFGNRIGSYFTRLAGELAQKWHVKLPNRDLGYLPEGTQEYDDYVQAVELAQRFAWRNREIMMARVLEAIGAHEGSPSVYGHDGDGVPSTIHMHPNYMAKERHFGQDVLLTRKGAVDANHGKWVIIPGSMGAKTYIGLGLGNPDSFHSCSHGAGRVMSRTEALKTLSLTDHEKATEGVVCDKTRGTLDETPACYKNIDDVMESQKDLVEPILAIKQLICVKGISE